MTRVTIHVPFRGGQASRPHAASFLPPHVRAEYKLMEPVELEIFHTTRYQFSQPVFLEPHFIRLQPRTDGGQQLVEFQLDIDPLPVGTSSSLDAAGNVMTQAWFEDMHEELSITTRSTTLMLRENPFDFLIPRSGAMLPLSYGAEAEGLRPYLFRGWQQDDQGDQIAVFASRMRDAARGELSPLLSSLNRTIFERFDKIRRYDGDPWEPMRTWREKRGACRDLAVLFIDVCRSLGVAARFVSGYLDVADAIDDVELHAWAEAYIPGAGWRGYDPARGLAVTQNHVAVAAAATSAGAAPIVGTFRGTGATSTLSTAIRVERRCRALAAVGA